MGLSYSSWTIPLPKCTLAIFLRWASHQQHLHSYFWHYYASTEDRLLKASSRFKLPRMYSAEVRWPILRILLALNTPECDLCQNEKPSPFYNWDVPQAAQLQQSYSGLRSPGRSYLTYLCTVYFVFWWEKRRRNLPVTTSKYIQLMFCHVM